MSTKPVKEIRVGLVKAAIFEKEVEGAKGKFISKSISLQVGYKDKNDQIQNKNINLTSYEVKKVIEALQEVQAELDKKESEK